MYIRVLLFLKHLRQLHIYKQYQKSIEGNFGIQIEQDDLTDKMMEHWQNFKEVHVMNFMKIRL